MVLSFRLSRGYCVPSAYIGGGAVDIWHYADEMIGTLRHTYLHESSPQLFQMGKSWGLPMVVDVNKWMLATYFSDDSSHLPSFFSIFILLSSLVWFS